MEKVLIIDSNGIGHIAKHSMHGLSFQERETGVIFGFMSEVFRLAKRFETNKFAFTWDSRRNFRKEIRPTYKKKRYVEKSNEDQQLDETAREQFYMLRKKVLPLFGFKNNFIKTGYEADDIMANIVINNKKHDMIIVTGDEDIYQLLNFASIYNPRKKKVITAKDFTKEYNIPVNKWIQVKAIAGCGSDNVVGVPSVGEKTAIKYLNGELKKGVAFNNIKNNTELICSNLTLVTLPFIDLLGNKSMGKIPISFNEEKFTISNFLNLCETYGFSSFKKNLNEWNKLFRMV
jgi:DNA polymerase-1